MYINECTRQQKNCDNDRREKIAPHNINIIPHGNNFIILYLSGILGGMDFTARYNSLNTVQQAAVDYIHGPLLVIAGPGTGKTELLSMRSAQILRQTDTLPSNILCLTFTDSAAANMRTRLRTIIGEDAYQVAIHTFHSFGTEIITQNREYFFSGIDTQPTDELVQHQILQELFTHMGHDNPLATARGEEFVYIADCLSVISEFKRSGLTPAELRQILDDNERTINATADQIQRIFAQKITKQTIEVFAPLAEKVAQHADNKALPPSITPYAQVLALSIAHASQAALEDGSTKPITAWKNAWCEKSGDITALKDQKTLAKLRACVDLYETYNHELEKRRLFDYDDMILRVLSAVESHADLVANIREQFQYIMVDEFQDTNLAQLRLLFHLTSGDERPNIMVVGDDDQAIFSFQGADIGNIQRFRERYNPQIMVLTDNYRSAPAILTAARRVITQGIDRLETTIPDLSKELTAHVEASSQIDIAECTSPLEERAWVVKQIAGLIAQGTEPSTIAVLARRHHELVALLPQLDAAAIAVNYERYDDVLEQGIIKTLELVARIIISLARNDLDAANALLPEYIAHPMHGFSIEDIWKLSLAAYKNRSLWLETMLAHTTFRPLGEWLLERAQSVPYGALEEQIDAILEPLVSYYFHDPHTDPDAYLTALEALRTLRQKLRDHYASQTPTLAQFIQFVDLHRSTGTRLTSIRAHSDTQSGAVNLMTAHKAKGLEFDHVFIIGATDAAWGEKARERSRLIRYPANLPLAPAGTSYDERLRLFFVAMTRAKFHLVISYANSDESGKDALIAQFLSGFTTRQIKPLSAEKATKAMEADWRRALAGPITPHLKDLLAPTLERYKLSATHLNTFLDVSRGGPQNFLLNNLLRFPSAKSPAASYGTAIHASLQQLHNLLRADHRLPPAERILHHFRTSLEAQHLPPDDFKLYLDKGTAALTAFLDAKSSDFHDTELAELDFAHQGVVVGGARLTGKLDVADIDKHNKTIFVTDYKTGKPSHSWKGTSDYEKIKLHKYRQQLMFYQLLVKSSRDYSNFTFTGARLQFVEPDMKTSDILSLEDTFSEEELAEFARLISVVWRKITALELPDISGYSADYKGMVQFENDLLTGEI